jgi:glycerophosphoryl diester phosphodiesterase
MRMGLPIRPVVIAHRGACGYLPEHTFPAKALAYSMGADYLEQDVVATRDDELVVLHDIHLDRVTDVADQFPDRARDNERYYVRDFTLAEIKTLTVHERTNADGSLVYPHRYQSSDEVFRVNTFAEELQFIDDLKTSVGRPVGIYPEIKKPAWHRDEGVDITKAFLDVLRRFDYESYDDPVYVQCFDDMELIRIRNELECDLKLIQLVGENEWAEANTDYDLLRSNDGLRKLASTVDGIGPWINQLYEVQTNGRIKDSGLVAKAHDAGLAVHPYTFRHDDLAPGFKTFEELIDFMTDQLFIDGLFTDFPDLVINACGPH